MASANGGLAQTTQRKSTSGGPAPVALTLKMMKDG
jgi:hypothetical protein